eukprot:1154130-Pelagomonas_calceolata.AAC.3
MGPGHSRKEWPPRWTTTHNTNTTGALSPETLSLVPIITPSHPDFQASVCHPINAEEDVTQALCHAIYSAILNTEATDTLCSSLSWDNIW